MTGMKIAPVSAQWSRVFTSVCLLRGGQDEDQAEGEEQDENGREPPFFADAQEAPEFT